MLLLCAVLIYLLVFRHMERLLQRMVILLRSGHSPPVRRRVSEPAAGWTTADIVV